MIIPTPLIAVSIIVASLGLVGTAVYIEPFASMVACPMCMMQRAIYLGVAAFALLALVSLRKPLLMKTFSGLGALTAIGGAAVAGRQVWLQNLPPDQVPACGPPFEYMIEVFPLMEVIQTALMGTGDCAEIQWQWLGLSIPGWSTVAFSGLALANFAMMLKRN